MCELLLGAVEEIGNDDVFGIFDGIGEVLVIFFTEVGVDGFFGEDGIEDNHFSAGLIEEVDDFRVGGASPWPAHIIDLLGFIEASLSGESVDDVGLGGFWVFGFREGDDEPVVIDIFNFLEESKVIKRGEGDSEGQGADEDNLIFDVVFNFLDHFGVLY